MWKRVWRRIVTILLRPKWVAFKPCDESQEELGIKVWGVVFALYKADTLAYTPASTRRPAKREFGESLHPRTLEKV